MTVFDKKPWLKFYEPHVPEHIDYPNTNMPAVLTESATRHPQRNYIVYKGKEIAYEAFNQDVDRFAAALQAFGIAEGDRVAIHLPNCPQFPMAYFATLRIGAVAVPCNPAYTARELTHQLKDSGAKIAITLTAFYPTIKQLRPETELERARDCGQDQDLLSRHATATLHPPQGEEGRAPRIHLWRRQHLLVR
jgi:long-chain acyl-CoA synthetase